MKRKHIAYSILAGITLLQVSCTKLDEEVFDRIPTTEFGVNDKQINAIIAPIYGSLQLYFPGAPWQLAEASSDMSVVPTRKGGDWWGGGQWKEIERHSWTPNTATINGVYTRLTGGVATCNQIYHTINSSTAPIPNKEQVLAEIRGVRAFWYYQLLDFFGNVPIATDFTKTDLPSTSTRKEVYEFVLSELNAIKDVVRSDVSNNSYGKMTKGAVYTLLAKMYLNALVWNPQGGAKWEEAAAACDVVMGLGYALEPNWQINFDVANQVSKEFILPAVFSRSSGANNIGQQSLHYLAPIALGLKINCFNGISAMPAYYNSFDPEDKRLAWSFLTGAMRDPATGNVLVTAHGRNLILTPSITHKYSIDADGWGQVEQEDGARCSKWKFENGLATPNQENDFAIFRLADVHLMKAEALVRLGRDNNVATQLVNNVRRRAFDNPAKLFTSVTLDDVYNERRFELAWEGFGRQDQIRFGTFLNAIPDWKPARTNTNLLLFPIPQNALNANPNLKQNPGY
jgi:hypothetical protein